MSTTRTGRAASLARSRAAAIPKLRLLFTPERGICTDPPFVLMQGRRSVIGRAVRSDEGIQLSDERVSRQHAQLQLTGSDVTVTDCGSKNGTYLNGAHVSSAKLKDGDILQIGDSFLVMRVEPLRLPPSEISSLAGASSVIRQLSADILSVARTSLSVLLLGESGTGKEVAAHALHAESGRQGMFVAVNCTAIPESLAESVLFGQIPGAYTGATAQPGLFRAAEGGTLLLDEVGDLSAPMQPKLLRVLETGEVYPVGSTRSVRVNVRVVAATNQDLPQLVRLGRFRGDLYTRLAGSTLLLPPLRTRREDILILAGRFHPELERVLNVTLVAALLLHSWPYNVRELKKVMEELKVRGNLDATLRRLEEAMARTADASIGPPEDEQPGSQMGRPRGAPAPTREQLIAVLSERHGIIRQVAQTLGCSARQVGRWIEQYKLEIEDYRRKPA